MIVHDHLLIGGQPVTSAGRDTIDVVDPASEEIVGRVPSAVPADVDRAVAVARASFDDGPWRRWTAAQRAAVLATAGEAIVARTEELAALITAEMGCTLPFARWAQVPPAAGQLAYYAGLAGTIEHDEQLALGGRSVVRQVPVGVVAAIVPWNAPLFIAVNKVAPALAAGCSVILKPSPHTPLDAYVLAEVLAAAGLPDGALSVLPAGREASSHLVRHVDVDKISFTGSTRTGRWIAAACGERLGRVSLELGGKSAAIICEDADLAATVEGLVPRMFANNGQVCTAQTRILAPRRRVDEVVAALAEVVDGLRVGDPRDPDTDIGPLVDRTQQQRVERYVACGRDEGARIAAGGQPLEVARGSYVAPVLFDRVDNAMTIAREEIFGPVICVIAYDDRIDATRIANDSPYGLYASVWSTDQDEARAIARDLRTGNVSINGAWGAADAPFGGFKQSGIGRELGPAGLLQCCETQSIHVA